MTQDGPAEAAVAADRVPEWARGVSTVAVLTGAGVSTDSGIPDFRGHDDGMIVWAMRARKPSPIAAIGATGGC